MVRLPRQLPLKVAVHLALTGEPMDALTAERWGLANAVVPAERVLDRALQLAEQICTNAPLAVQASKRVLYGIADGRVGDEESAWAINRVEAKQLQATDDAAEGPRAFAEKRPPAWKAR
jgi:crotonobetainyl-CoA hydratase